MKLLRLAIMALGFTFFNVTGVHVFALSIGELSVFSEPEQPLRAVLAINQLGATSYQQIKVMMPSAIKLRKLGLLPSQIASLNFNVFAGRKGSALVYIRSARPLSDLSAIALDIRWPHGQQTEGFLLNLEKTKQYYSKLYQSYKNLTLTQSSGRLEGKLYGPIRPYDTLWKVAERVRPSKSVTVQQTMLALLEQNPRAFIAGDMNQMQRGQVLLIPPKQIIATIPKRGARFVVQQQIKAWQQGKRLSGPKTADQVVHLAPGDLPLINSDGHWRVIQQLVLQIQNLQGALVNIQQDNEKLHKQLVSFEAQMGQLVLTVERQRHYRHAQPQFSVEKASVNPIATSSAATSDNMANFTAPLSVKTVVHSVTSGYRQSLPREIIPEQKPLWLQALDSLTYWGTAVVVLLFLGLFWLAWRLRREHVRRLEDQAVLRATIERMQHTGR
ncbi:FimV family protein [Piscirickettsia salmonis]|uniref:type IV pilus assembly protein FimV n=1 Tax=Piscirickettsia salmonis TaxID=1238 RepID=UPI000F07B210|nr:fimbrial protein FimV [Piscirickettsiaceae bacterium NZ-RLO2]